MKKHTILIIRFYIVTIILVSCSKNDSPAKDYTTSIKGKTWWGTLTYTGKPIENYSVQFNADNTLVWRQLSGDYTGHWSLTDNALTMTFDGNTAIIKATISTGNKLTNIADNTGFYEINSGQIIANSNVVLDNSVWKGSPVDNFGTTPPEIRVTILTVSKMESQIASNMYGIDTYTRSASGAVIRVEPIPGFYIFFVVLSENEIRGNDNSNPYQWKLIKQGLKI